MDCIDSVGKKQDLQFDNEKEKVLQSKSSLSEGRNGKSSLNLRYSRESTSDLIRKTNKIYIKIKNHNNLNNPNNKQNAEKKPIIDLSVSANSVKNSTQLLKSKTFTT